MHSIRHWKPRYLLSRIRDKRYQRRHPDRPWLTPDSNRLLETLLRPVDRGVEWGAGRSTLWLARRVAHLLTIEHDPGWVNRVEQALAREGIENVDLRLHPYDEDKKDGEDALEEEYVREIGKVADSNVDFVLVDGRHRGACALSAVSRIAPGGMIIVDDVHRYLPSPSRSPFARREGDGPASELWTRFAESVDDWRLIWTTSGVSDTAIWIRPRNQLYDVG